MKRGGKRPGAGRPVGSKNITTAALRARIVEDADPIGLLVKVSNGEPLNGIAPSLAERIAAAKWLGERIMPTAKQATTALPDGVNLTATGEAARAVMKEIAGGHITPDEGADLLDALQRAHRCRVEQIRQSGADPLALLSLTEPSIEDALRG